MRTALILLIGTGCNADGSVPVGAAPADSVDTQTDTQTDTPPDTTEETPTDTGAPETEEEVDRYPRTWTGTRLVVFEGYCDDTIYESGEEITENEDYARILSACEGCGQLYVVNNDPSSICYGQVGVSDFNYRGLIYREEGEVEVVGISEDDGGSWAATSLGVGVMSEGSLSYEYGGSYYGYDYEIYGEITIE